MPKKKTREKTITKKSLSDIKTIPIKGILTRHGFEIQCKITLTRADWDNLALLYFEDDGKSAESFHNDFYSAFIMKAKSEMNRGKQGQHTNALFSRAIKVQAAMLYSHLRDHKKKTHEEALSLTMSNMGNIYSEWCELYALKSFTLMDKIYSSRAQFDEREEKKQASFFRRYVQEGQSLILKEDTSVERGFICSMLCYEKDQKTSAYLNNKKNFDILFALMCPSKKP